MHFDLKKIKGIDVLEVAQRLGLPVTSYKKKIHCITKYHEDRNPSMGFCKKNNTWKCYSCGASGSTIDLVMQVNNIDFQAACKWLYNMYNYSSPISDVYSSCFSPKTINIKRNIVTKNSYKCKPNFEIYQWIIDNTILSDSAKFFLCEQRKLSIEVINSLQIKSIDNIASFLQLATKKWGKEQLEKCGLLKLGLAWYKNPIIFPYYNREGKIVQIQARAMKPQKSEERFANLSGIETCLYNMQIFNRLHIGDSLIICEGVTDCLAVLSAGLNSIAVPGAAAYKEEYTRMLKPFNVYICPDKDPAGYSLKKIVQESFCKSLLKLNLFNLPTGYKDFSEYYIAYKNGQID